MNNTTMKDEQIESLAKWAETEDIEELDYDHYGLKVLEIDGYEYAIGTYEDVKIAAYEYIKNSVWTFNSWFIADHTTADIDTDIIEMIQEKCENGNDAILRLIDDLDEFVDDAISADGLGHFMATYDSDEIEIDNLYLYRIN